MKTIIVFNDSSEGDVEKLRDVQQASSMRLALWKIGQEVFRPARKHGYQEDPALNKLLENNEEVAEAIGLLESKFYEILNDLEVTVD